MNKKIVIKAVIALCVISLVIAGIALWPRKVIIFDQTNNVLVVKGDVNIKKAKDPSAWQKTGEATVLEKGDVIQTSKDSTIDVVIGTDVDKLIKLEENSRLEIVSVNPGLMKLSKGRIRVALKKLEPKSSFVVKTPVAICGARGTAWSEGTTDTSTDISVFQNSVYAQALDDNGKARTKKLFVSEGAQVMVEKGRPIGAAQRLSDRELKDWQFWMKSVEFLRAGKVLIDDFERKENFNNLGGPLGSWNMFYNDPTQYCRDEFTETERVGDSGYGLKLTYDVDSQFSAYNGFFTNLMGINLSKYKSLVFYIKGDKEAGFTTKINLELKNNRNEIGRAFVEGITGEWQKMVVPFKQFTGIRDYTSMKEIVIIFSDINVTKKEGVIYLDDIYFSKTE